MIDPLDYPYSIYKSSDGDALLDAHNDIIAVFDPHTEPEIEFMLANAPEMLELLRKARLEMDNALLTYIPVGEDGNDMAKLLGEIETLIERIDGEEART